MANERKLLLDPNSQLNARLSSGEPVTDTPLSNQEANEESNIKPKMNPLSPTSTNTNLQPETIDVDQLRQLVSFTLRVDESVDKGLKLLCSNERITKETFLEAAYLVCQDNSQMMSKVLEIAKARRQERRETGVLRRAKAMLKYLD